MAETTVWRGTSSQWQNFGRFFLAAFLAAIVIAVFVVAKRSGSGELSNFSPYVLIFLLAPIVIAARQYLQTKNRVYELTTERIKTSQGVFSRVTDTLELYRVKDLETRQPFLSRIVGIENIELTTSDASSPLVVIPAVSADAGLPDKIRNQVEAVRAQKGVREVDVE